jgi:G3E family GTPase
MRIHLLSGFLGSGKTTAIRQACKVLLNDGTTVGVITNDQGIKLVDGYFFKNLGIPERQVGNGCFCCNYNDLDKSIGELVEEHQPEVIFAESVGTCTDIVATVMKPISRYRKVSGLSLTTVVDARLLEMIVSGRKLFDEEVEYIFFKQIEEAGIILINKMDLIGKEGLDKIEKYLNDRHPGKKLIAQSSIAKDAGGEWLRTISAQPAHTSLTSVEVDYDHYAVGEAKMGYLDQQLIVVSDKENAIRDALHIIEAFVRNINISGSPIGHVKFWLNDRYKLSYAATTAPELPAENEIGRAATCTLIVNARVQTDPANLYAMMSAAIAGGPYNVQTVNASFFKPGYPRPVHRIQD